MLTRLVLGLVILLLAWPLQANRDPLHVELHLEPPHLDPTLTPASTVAEATYGNIFQGLTRINRDGEVEPLLARDWILSPDGLTYTFHLREGVHFHNGRLLTPEVVVFSLERLLDPAGGNSQRELYASIRKVEALAAQRVRIELHYPDSLLLFRLGLSAAVLVEPDSAETNTEQPVGTGPYRVTHWDAAKNRLNLYAFADYWGDKPAISEALITFTSNRVELEASLLEGQIDLYPNISPMDSVVRLTERGDYVINNGVTQGETLLVMNHAHPALADRRVRQAINHAIDKRELLNIYPRANPPLIGSHFSPLDAAYVDLVDYYPYDPGRARDLLLEAGYAQGLTLRFRVPPALYAQQASLYLADYLEAVGINIQLERVTWPQWLEEVFNEQRYDLTVIAHVEPLDLDIYAREDYYFNYVSEDFQQLWQAITREADPVQRQLLLGQAQELLAADAVHVFLHIKPQQSIRKKGLRGFWINAPVPAVMLEELYWE
ncbi:ABC transporter substrate-binding protein [Marinospirillum perlucidum]|uniref:ABC transporter substrate-binding protein n=1 Tax=Marinospirillum perlucidum TaxID=1982602 RepID=UPI000DF38912|nr:ABC transporter substrate-binding protein [Marinospirillum perlucidum]